MFICVLEYNYEPRNEFKLYCGMIKLFLNISMHFNRYEIEFYHFTSNNPYHFSEEMREFVINNEVKLYVFQQKIKLTLIGSSDHGHFYEIGNL